MTAEHVSFGLGTRPSARVSIAFAVIAFGDHSTKPKPATRRPLAA